MSDVALIIFFTLISALAVGLFFYPLRKNFHTIYWIFIPCFILFFIIAYHYWGGWVAWRQFNQEQAKREEAKALLAKMKSPDELIAKLKMRLNDKPESARGWYLLGRLYVNDDRLLEARDAFAKAYQLNQEDEIIIVNYAYILWQLNQQKLNATSLQLFHLLLKKNPNQPDALAMLAMAAYDAHNCSKAKYYWRKLLKLVPRDSKEAAALKEAIAKCQKV